MRLFVLLGALVAASGVCAAAPLIVCLDYLPNPNHVPLYAALDSGAFAERGLEVDLVVPTSASDPAKLAAVRSADLSLTPQINYLIARAEGLPLVAVGVLIDRSLGGLLTLSDRGVAELADLACRPIGYSLAPLEPALWRAMFACAGVLPDDVDLINIGYNTTAALLDGTVDAIGAFRNVEPLLPEIQERGPIFFAQEGFCVPETCDLIFIANPDVVRDRRSEVTAFLEAVGESIRETRGDPETALAAFFRAFPELDGEADRRSFEATAPLYAESVYLTDASTWDAIQEFLVGAGLLASSAPFESLVAPGLTPDGP